MTNQRTRATLGCGTTLWSAPKRRQGLDHRTTDLVLHLLLLFGQQRLQTPEHRTRLWGKRRVDFDHPFQIIDGLCHAPYKSQVHADPRPQALWEVHRRLHRRRQTFIFQGAIQPLAPPPPPRRTPPPNCVLNQKLPKYTGDNLYTLIALYGGETIALAPAYTQSVVLLQGGGGGILSAGQNFGTP